MTKNLQKFFKGKKVLITGHTGFKGSWLSQILLLWGARVSGISLKPNTKPSFYTILGLNQTTNSHITDIRDFKKVKTIFEREKPDIVFHLAAQPIVRESYDNPLYTMETNIIGTANVLEAIRQISSVKAVVMITTDKVYEDMNTRKPYKEGDRLGGHDPYSASKACAELVIVSYRKSFFNPDHYGRTHTTLVASARAGNIIGGGDWSKDRIIPDLARAVFVDETPLTIRNPKATRPWQYVLQPLYGYMLLAQKLYDGHKMSAGAWNFGPVMKNCLSVEKILNIAFEYLGKGSFIFSPDNKKHEAALLALDSTKARKHLGWKGQFSIKDSVEWTLDWYKNYYDGGDPIAFSNQQINLFFKNEL